MSFIKKLSPEARKHIEFLLRSDRYTIDELLENFSEKFPDEAPARSTMGRAKKKFEEEARELREVATAADVLVSEFGLDTDEKGGILLAQAVQAVVTRRALNELKNTGEDPEKPQMDIDGVGSLARAARAAIMTKSKAMENREDIVRLARAELIREQEKNLDEAVASKGMTEEQKMFWKEKILGIVQ